jgi:hypothetical protein
MNGKDKVIFTDGSSGLAKDFCESCSMDVSVQGRKMWSILNQDTLDLIERNLILSLVVELGRARRLVVGDVLRGFKRAVVLQVRGDAGRPEGTVPDPGLDASAARPPLDHAVGVLLPLR